MSDKPSTTLACYRRESYQTHLPSEPEKARLQSTAPIISTGRFARKHFNRRERGKKFISNPVPKWSDHRGGARSDHCLRLIAPDSSPAAQGIE